MATITTHDSDVDSTSALYRFNFALLHCLEIDSGDHTMNNYDLVPFSTLGISQFSRHQMASGLRQCLRCFKNFTVNPATGKASPIVDQCRYHPGTIVYDEDNEMLVFSCCGRISNPYTDKQGCQYHNLHVHDCRLFSLKLQVPESYDMRQPMRHATKEIYSIGVKPAFTNNGVEVCELTIVNQRMKVVFKAAISTAFDLVQEVDSVGEKCQLETVQHQLGRFLPHGAVMLLGFRWRLAKCFLHEACINNVHLRIANEHDKIRNDTNFYRSLQPSISSLEEAIATMEHFAYSFDIAKKL